MAESNVQATRKGVFSRHPLIARWIGMWNPYVLAHPITRRLLRFAVLKHTGRRSGRVYATPVSARPTATGFVVPLTFGEKAAWYRNVLAANGCVIEWKGVEYRLIDPQMVSSAEALPAYHPVERLILPLLGIKQYVQFRYAPVDGEDSHPETALPGHALRR
ncbi:MAG TPA: nitroreductase family deazaflavin-dependent oxidoreductase [Ktedonobacteraceae bacterium]|jgi:deazaflavin-dependent oxidoreductase (nitroreductase family)|nr:nitroreductase family deazaflavin-dependent oxidoreductase [Ktedonobacteraceae bacterium]